MKNPDQRREEKRRPIPLSVKLAVALRQLADLMGCEHGTLQLDHDPALDWRPWNDKHTDTIPPANSIEHLFWRPAAVHKVKTFGPGGDKRVHTRGSDVSEPGRLDKIAVKHAEFRKSVLAVKKQRKPKSKGWPKRKFDSNRRRR